MEQTKTIPRPRRGMNTKTEKCLQPEPGLKASSAGLQHEKLFLAETRNAERMGLEQCTAIHTIKLVYIVRGHLKVTARAKTFDLRTGDTFVVRGGVEHGASAFDASIVIDVFTPWRDDYLS